jgi:hypothetical protein
MPNDDRLDLVLTSGDCSTDTLIVCGPLHLWARLLRALAHEANAATSGDDAESSDPRARAARTD